MSHSQQQRRSSRSMGTVEPRVMPMRVARTSGNTPRAAAAAQQDHYGGTRQRTSVTPQNPPARAGGGGALPRGRSALPVPVMSARSSSSGSKGAPAAPKRSSSTGPMAERNLNTLMHNVVRTPRSSSAKRTPKSPRSGVGAPLPILGRLSMGMGCERPSWIGSKVTKDPRNIQDKLWRQAQQQRLMAFLANKGYATDAVKWPLTSTEFRKMFEFLFSHVDPDHELPPRFEQTVPDIMKKIGYTVNLSKSSFQTIGTTHSWPVLLGVLSHLLDRVEVILHIHPNMDAIVFPNVDQHGFTNERSSISDEKIGFNYYLECFRSFNEGRDEPYDEELEDAMGELLENYQINPDNMKQMEHDVRRKQEELEHESNSKTFEYQGKRLSMGEFSESRDAKLDDVKKLQTYYESMMNFKERCVGDVEKNQHGLDQLKARHEALLLSLATLEQACSSQTNLVENFTNLAAMLEEKRQMVAKKKEEIEGIQTVVWQLEMSRSKAREELAKNAQQFNRILAKYDIARVERLDADSPPAATELDGLRATLQDLITSTRQHERGVEGELIRTEAELAQLKQHVQKTESGKTSLEKEVESSRTELAASGGTAESGERALAADIGALRAAVEAMRRNVSDSLESLSRELAAAREEIVGARKVHKDGQAHGLAFLDAAIEKADQFMQKSEDEFESAIWAVLDVEEAETIRLVERQKAQNEIVKQIADMFRPFRKPE